MLPNSAIHAFLSRKFSNRSMLELARITTTTDAYFCVSVSAYSAVVKLYGLKWKWKWISSPSQQPANQPPAPKRRHSSTERISLTIVQ